MRVRETDLYIRAEKDLTREAERAVRQYRRDLETYVAGRVGFAESLKPVEVEPEAPVIIRDMADAARKVGVGPMAAVAGAVAEYVGRDLLDFSNRVIVENGGDLFLAGVKETILGIYAGKSVLSGKLRLKIVMGKMPLGICTSSGTVGHSLSFGKADAALVIADSAILADACATAAGNMVGSAADFNRAIDFAGSIDGVRGMLLIVGDRMVAWGEVELV